jgi:hypothetical protein
MGGWFGVGAERTMTVGSAGIDGEVGSWKIGAAGVGSWKIGGAGVGSWNMVAAGAGS